MCNAWECRKENPVVSQKGKFMKATELGRVSYLSYSMKEVCLAPSGRMDYQGDAVATCSACALYLLGRAPLRFWHSPVFVIVPKICRLISLEIVSIGFYFYFFLWGTTFFQNLPTAQNLLLNLSLERLWQMRMELKTVVFKEIFFYALS